LLFESGGKTTGLSHKLAGNLKDDTTPTRNNRHK